MSRAASKNVRVLLIDDHALFRESVARLLNAEQGFEVVADCSSGAEALRILKSREVDVILLDWDLGPERGAEWPRRYCEFRERQRPSGYWCFSGDDRG